MTSLPVVSPRYTRDGKDPFGCQIDTHGSMVSHAASVARVAKENTLISIEIVSSNFEPDHNGKEVLWHWITVASHARTWQVVKRYSDFMELRAYLKSQHKYNEPPSLPQRLLLRKTNANIEERRCKLEIFLRTLMEYAIYHRALSVFLQDNSSTYLTSGEGPTEGSSTAPMNSTSDVFPQYCLIHERETFIIVLDLPGVAAEQVSIHRGDLALTISGYRTQFQGAEPSKKKSVTLRRHDSRWSGPFYLEIQIPLAFCERPHHVRFMNGECTIWIIRDANTSEDSSSVCSTARSPSDTREIK